MFVGSVYLLLRIGMPVHGRVVTIQTYPVKHAWTALPDAIGIEHQPDKAKLGCENR